MMLICETIFVLSLLIGTIEPTKRDTNVLATKSNEDDLTIKGSLNYETKLTSVFWDKLLSKLCCCEAAESDDEDEAEITREQKVQPKIDPKDLGYELHKKFGWYKVYDIPKTHHRAELRCQKDGGHLAVPDTREETQLLTQLARKMNQANIWIGVHDHNEEGHYETVKAEPYEIGKATDWYGPPKFNQQPDNGKDVNYLGFNVTQQCLRLNTGGSVYDYWCDGRDVYVCEIPYV